MVSPFCAAAKAAEIVGYCAGTCKAAGTCTVIVADAVPRLAIWSDWMTPVVAVPEMLAAARTFTPNEQNDWPLAGFKLIPDTLTNVIGSEEIVAPQELLATRGVVVRTPGGSGMTNWMFVKACVVLFTTTMVRVAFPPSGTGEGAKLMLKAGWLGGDWPKAAAPASIRNAARRIGQRPRQ